MLSRERRSKCVYKDHMNAIWSILSNVMLNCFIEGCRLSKGAKSREEMNVVFGGTLTSERGARKSQKMTTQKHRRPQNHLFYSSSTASQ